MISILLVIFLVLCSLFRYSRKKFDGFDTSFDQIPGPKGLPFIGNIGDLFCDEEERWRRMRKRGLQYYPIYKMKVLGTRMTVLLDPVDVEAILSNPKYISKGAIYAPGRDWLGNGILLSTGETWQKSRKLLTKSFHFGALKDHVNIMNETTDYFLSLMETEIEKPLEVSFFLNIHSFKVLCETLLEKRIVIGDTSTELFIKSIKEMTKIINLKMNVPLMNILYKYTHLKEKEDMYLKIYKDYLTDILEKNRNSEDENPSKFLNILLKNYDEFGQRDELSTFLFAGQDTTSIALTFLLYILGNKPHFQDEILNEIIETCGNERPTYGQISQMNFLDRFIKEGFRMYPTATFIGRSLDYEFPTPSGYTIPAGTNILIQIFDIHRNPEIYPNPDVFDPDRFLPENVRKRHPYSFIPFSAGPRNCIAQKFAMLELKATLCGILEKYEIEPLGTLEDIVLIPDLLLKSKYPLRVKLIPRSTG